MVRSIPHDLLIDLRSSAMPFFCGARYAPLWAWREYFLPKQIHEAERNIWCMSTIGVPVYSRRLRFFVPGTARLSVRKELQSKGIDRPLILFNPGGQLKKAWPLENFSQLAKRLLDMGKVKIGIVGYSDHERGMAGAICGDVASPHCVDLSGCHRITRLGALLEKTVLFVSNDTGPLHLASAMGTPTVGLYLPQNLPRFGPWCNPHRCLVAVESGGEGIRMGSIKVEDVYEACIEMIRSCNLLPDH